MAQTAEKHKTAQDLIAEGAPLPPRARFRSFSESTAEDWAAIMLKGEDRHDAVMRLCLEHLEML